VPVDPAATPVEHVRASLDQRLRALLAHEPGTRTGQDIEDLHQMRVAVRRMRATLKAAQPLLDTAWADDLRAELGWLGGALGPVRDLDVLLLRLHREIAGLPAAERSAGGVLLDALERERTTARAAMLDALTTPRYVALLERLADTVRAPLPAPAPGDAAEPRSSTSCGPRPASSAAPSHGRVTTPPTRCCTRCASGGSGCGTPASWWRRRCAAPRRAGR